LDPQEARRRCKVATHKALVTRLLFILTRCSRLVVPEEPSPTIDSTALYTQVPSYPHRHGGRKPNV
jgi:hypothetical protein